MAEVLKEWLSQRLQRNVTWETEEFGDMMKDGHILASLLLSYHVINDEKFFLIKASKDPKSISTNWSYLTEWLKEMDINVADTSVNSISQGNGSEILRLYYQLFLYLDNKDRSTFIKRERKMVTPFIEKVTNRFKVNKVVEEPEVYVDDLSRPLLNEKQFIEWQKKKSDQLKETYDYMKHRYSKMLEKLQEEKSKSPYCARLPTTLTKKDKSDIEKFSERHPCKFENIPYQSLLESAANAYDIKESIGDNEWAQKYMKNLHKKLKNKTDAEDFQSQLAYEIENTIWDALMAEEESKADQDLAKKVMKLSQFEKQMCTQLLETKQQARNLIQNRIRAEKEYNDQKEMQFGQFLDNLKEHIHLEFEEVDFEKHRQEMLHKRLYAEKMKRKRQYYYEICYDTMLALVDYIAKYMQFKELLGGEDIPEHYTWEWKKIFFKHQPLFDTINPLEDILEDHDAEEEINIEDQDIYKTELDRQETLNDNDFLEYLNYTGPWRLDLLIPNFDSSSLDNEYEKYGLNILGHVIYTLLNIKYPYPPQRPPADLPNFETKAITRGVPDRTIAATIQELLNHRDLHVVRLECAVNYCMQLFKREMIGCTDIDLAFDKLINEAHEENRDLVKAVKEENDLLVKNSTPSSTSGIIPPNQKFTQTPKTIPEEEIVLSTPAELGQYAYNSIYVGEELTDFLLASMIVEYVKAQDDIKGFVIINYPNHYRQAQILEELFSGREPPDEVTIEDNDDIYLEENIAKHRKKLKDLYKDIRVSKLVKDPHKKKTDKPFESYFTCYLRLRETDDILKEEMIWYLNAENSELIDRFYAILGLNYSMYYEKIDNYTLVQLCRYLIGDFEFPIKTDAELFGGSVLSKLDLKDIEVERQNKSRVYKAEVTSSTASSKSGEMREYSETSKSSIYLDKTPIQSEIRAEECKGEQQVSHEGSIIISPKAHPAAQVLNLLPGEEDWDYSELPIQETVGISLASFWEEIERTYVKDIQTTLFSVRLQMNVLVPYTRFIKDKIYQIITLPSEKQDNVQNFQKDFNDFENDWRDINQIKNEWHCRVKKLQEDLYKICDSRKAFALNQRHQLILDNWAMEELTSMVNSYITCMQAELNRSFLTYHSMHDFFFTTIKGYPTSDRPPNKELVKIKRENERGGEDKGFTQLKTAYIDLQLKNMEVDFTNNPFNSVIENNVKYSMKLVKDACDSYKSLINREYAEVVRTGVPVKKTTQDVDEESISPEEIIKENKVKAIEEWTMGVNGEMYRATNRFLAIQYKCLTDMKLFNNLIYKTFTDVLNDINNFYAREIKAVDQLCKYFQIAIEEGRRIPETLVLELDYFLIDPNLLQFEQEDISTVSDLRHTDDINIDFKMSQLANLRNNFKMCAPTGIILLQDFVYLIQDFIIYGAECCEGPIFPDLWKKMKPENVQILVFDMFGETVFVDWRDFLVYCLNIRFPTCDELLELRKTFRCIDHDGTELLLRKDFMNQKLWFEEDIEAPLRIDMIKHFLFELYETAPDVINYSALLLALSKNADPIEGFTTALSMAVGKKCCYKGIDCDEVICMLIEKAQYKRACHECAVSCANTLVNQLVENVCQICFSTTITEIANIAIPINNKKSGKGTKTHSAREPKQSVSSGKNKSHSEASMQITYVCKPCDKKDMSEKNELSIEAGEEEKLIFALPVEDPDLCYYIPSSVLWKVLKITMPWHFDLIPDQTITPYVSLVTNTLEKLSELHENGYIIIQKFVEDPEICKLLHKVRKFTAVDVLDRVMKLSE